MCVEVSLQLKATFKATAEVWSLYQYTTIKDLEAIMKMALAHRYIRELWSSFQMVDRG